MGQQPCKLNLSLMMEHLSDFICLSGLQGVGGTEIGIFKSHMIVNLLCTETMNDRSQVTGHIAEEQFVSSLIWAKYPDKEAGVSLRWTESMQPCPPTREDTAATMQLWATGGIVSAKCEMKMGCLTHSPAEAFKFCQTDTSWCLHRLNKWHLQLWRQERRKLQKQSISVCVPSTGGLVQGEVATRPSTAQPWLDRNLHMSFEETQDCLAVVCSGFL